jgi:mannitol-1-phosphate 5-dehydrogenase
MPKLVQFGAGNIGRSFLGQLFARAGYEVVFVDIDAALVAALNAQRAYRLIVKHGDRQDETVWVRNVRAVHAGDAERVASEVADADLAATAVGARALAPVLTLLAKGLELRRHRQGDAPLDVILAENLNRAAEMARTCLQMVLPEDYPLDRLVGLVETSIGKMVPLMRQSDLEVDPLWVFAEPYNRLILDKRAFLNPIPEVPGLAPMENMKAYVDRKLFIHNLGHAASAYFGYRVAPERELICEALEIEEVRARARAAMMQSADALCVEYPNEFNRANLEAHVDDLLSRFANRALGDSVYRVGRDLYRKLAREDRVVGALRLAVRHALPVDAIAPVVVAATQFRARDENGAFFPSDERFFREEVSLGLDAILTRVCKLSPSDPFDARVREAVLKEGGGQ